MLTSVPHSITLLIVLIGLQIAKHSMFDVALIAPHTSLLRHGEGASTTNDH